MVPTGGNPDAIIVEEHPGTARQLKALLAAMGYSPRVVDGERSLAHVPGWAGPDVMLLGLDYNLAQRVAYARLALGAYPGIAVIGYSTLYSAEIMADAMAAGVRRVLRMPFEAASLFQAVTDVHGELRALTQRAMHTSGNGVQPSRQSEAFNVIQDIEHQIVAVSSPKGGVGSSTLAVNLAVALQRCGYPTALVDGNFNFASHNVFLDLEPVHSIADLAEDPEGVTPEALTAVIAHHRTGLQVLLAPEHPEDADSVLSEQVQQVLAIFKARCTFTVIDAWPCFDGRTLAALELASTVLVPMGPDLPTMKNVNSYLRVMDLLRFDMQKFMLVLMRADTVSPREVKEIEAVLKHRIKWRVVSDGPGTTNAANTGMPFVLSTPDADVSQNVFEIARFLCVSTLSEMPAEGTKKQSVMERLFRL